MSDDKDKNILSEEDHNSEKETPAEVSPDDELSVEQPVETDWEDKYLRLYADFENFRRRSTKERLELSSFVRSEAVCKFLPILDDIERAIVNMTEDDKKSATFDGVKMVQSKFQNILNNLGVMEMKINLNKDTLDPTKHEALTTMPTENESHKGTIITVAEKGYILNDSVIRFAKVIIGA